MSMRILVLTLIVLGVQGVQAGFELKNFTTGNYIRTSGNDEQCGGEGDFSISENYGYPQLNLGVHVLDIRNHKEDFVDDNKPGCVYKSEDKVSIKGSTTILLFESKYYCHGELVNVLTKKMTILKDNLSLHVSQMGKPKYEYICTWVVPQRKVDSANRKYR